MAKNKSIVPEARVALDSFKEEIARELGLENFTYAGYVGGNMVRKMIETAEKELAEKNRQ
ncbi:alpha/beta-type small acid-soluble spore protein [Thermotalea metallivorans]|uniref:Small, acid-soluble spore protein alpha n=1 Tax=Thermotalea metallivorans TaxID=520762 RepID=A0A140L8I6_9FIRM|nr:alpha/beta-type small acid-soluble spore protein [Thermotalea metallivorans]KXG76861.1 Small, acid-soluble spore protein alpha [Thermotalea metallivorans]